MKLLITGATGFIGSHLVKRLSTDHELYCLVADMGKTKPSPHIEWIHQDLASPLDESRIPGGIHAIIHLAQSRHYRDFPGKVGDMFEVNMKSTLSLLELGRRLGVEKFIYASSGGIYGYSYEKFIETDSTNPINFYLTTKYCSELMIRNYNAYFHTVVLRFFFVYGPGQRGMLIPRLIDSIQKGDSIILYGKEGVRINPIHVSDAIKVFQPSLESPVTGSFNVAGDEVVSIKGVSEMIGDLLEKSPHFSYEKSGVTGDILGDNSRMKTMLGVIPEVSLKAGLLEMIR